MTLGVLTLSVLTVSVLARIFNPSGVRLLVHSLIPRPRPAFRHLLYGKVERAGYFFSGEHDPVLLSLSELHPFHSLRRLHRFAKTFNNISLHDRNSIITCDIYGGQPPRCCAAQKGLLRRLVNLVTALNTILRLNYSHGFASAISTVACGWAVLTVLSKFSVRC